MAKAKGGAVEDVTVCILDRPRHEQLVHDVRAAGARIKFISDGDVAGAVMACTEGTGVDLLLGIGGTPEGIITACAVKCLGGVIQAKLWPQNDSEFANAETAGLDLDADPVDQRPGAAATTSSSSRPASPTASSSAVSATAVAARRPSRS